MKTILLTNDDGFFSSGITALKERLGRSWRVVVVAPDRERSAISMALTLHHPLRVKEIAADVYAVDGTTADCVNIALQKVLPARPDFVVSGMNLGENLAEDIFFSGTVGGAFSGMLYGIPALAISLIAGPPGDAACRPNWDLDAAAQIGERVLERLLPVADASMVYNLNIPFPNNDRIMVTSLGQKRYTPDIIERQDPRGNRYYWIGTGIPTYGGEEGSDIWAVRNGFISLGVIHYGMNAAAEITRLKKIFDSK